MKGVEKEIPGRRTQYLGAVRGGSMYGRHADRYTSLERHTILFGGRGTKVNMGDTEISLVHA